LQCVNAVPLACLIDHLEDSVKTLVELNLLKYLAKPHRSAIFSMVPNTKTNRLIVKRWMEDRGMAPVRLRGRGPRKLGKTTMSLKPFISYPVFQRLHPKLQKLANKTVTFRNKTIYPGPEKNDLKVTNRRATHFSAYVRRNYRQTHTTSYIHDFKVRTHKNNAKRILMGIKDDETTFLEGKVIPIVNNVLAKVIRSHHQKYTALGYVNSVIKKGSKTTWSWRKGRHHFEIIHDSKDPWWHTWGHATNTEGKLSFYNSGNDPLSPHRTKHFLDIPT
jgi:hypothetical protein